MPISVVLAAAAVAASLPLLFWGLAGLGKTERPGMLHAPATPRSEGTVDQRALHLQTPALDRFVRPVLAALARRSRRMMPGGWVTALERKVRLAGSPRQWPVERVLGVKLLLGLTTLIVAILWITRLSLTAGSVSVTLGRFLLAPVAALGLYMLPDLLLRVRGTERQQLIQVQLPDALDQMTISVEAGLGFDAALQRFVGTGEGPLVDELRRTLNEVTIGIPRREAFQNLVDRTDVPELRHFVFAVNQAEEYGLPIAHVLRVQAKELRVIRRQRAEERAMKIPVKIVLPLVLCIFPALFIVILVPAGIRIVEALR